MGQQHSVAASRREFLRSTALAVGALGLPARRAGARGKARYRRVNVSGADGGKVLESYKKAIKAMLALPPDDRRNWYRHALVHTLDCPHGNWWFLPWHRGYTGTFERICRDLSGDPDFALPYWDWTELPQVPDAMFDDVLTPTHEAYIATYEAFRRRYDAPVANAGYWRLGSPFDPASQYGQLLARGVRFPADMWFDIADDPRGLFFFERAHARGLTREKPQLDGKTRKAVSLQTLLDALAPRDYLTFASPKALSHAGLSGFGVLEGMPHNKVHNCVGGIFTDDSGRTTDSGGFMQANLSPVDPLFFLHHSNIERLWDLWTRKQEARGYPILPDGYQNPRPNPTPPLTDYEIWAAEPFSFFIDAKGNPSDRKTAGACAVIGDFDYDYEPGSGEAVATASPAALAAPRPEVRAFTGRVAPAPAGAPRPARGEVTVPDAMLARAGAPGGPTLLAKITVLLPPSHHGDFAVLVNSDAGAAPDLRSPSHAATLSMFGHHTVHCPITFTVPLTGALAALRSGRAFRAGAPLDIRVVPHAQPGALAAHLPAHPEILSIVVEAH